MSNPKVMAFRRENGRVGIRNHVVILPLDDLSNSASEKVAFNVKGRPPSEIGLALDEDYGICCRVGLHCAPAAHRTIGTYPDGCVRLSPGPFTTWEECGVAIEAVRALAGRGG